MAANKSFYALMFCDLRSIDLDKEIFDVSISVSMISGTFSCINCKSIFQLIGISAAKKPKYCSYCGKCSIRPHNVILG